MGADYYIHRYITITFKDGTVQHQNEKERGDIQDLDIKKYGRKSELLKLVMDECIKDGSGFAFKDGKWQSNDLKYHVEGWGTIDTDRVDTIQVYTNCFPR